MPIFRGRKTQRHSTASSRVQRRVIPMAIRGGAGFGPRGAITNPSLILIGLGLPVPRAMKGACIVFIARNVSARLGCVVWNGPAAIVQCFVTTYLSGTPSAAIHRVAAGDSLRRLGGSPV